MMSSRIVWTLAIAAAMLAGNAAAQEPTPKPKPEPAPKPQPQDTDAAFLEKAARANLMEIAMGQLAGTQSENSAVKEFGQKMVTEHQRMNTELSDLATRKSKTLPTTLTKEEQKMVDDLGKLRGKEFDKKFMSSMVSDHEKAVQLFKTTSTSGQDADIKSFASSGLPKLEEHLKDAKALRDKVNAEKTGEPKPKPDKPNPDKPEKPDKPDKPDKP